MRYLLRPWVALLLLLVGSSIANAGQLVTLAWDANPTTEGVAGYIVYCGPISRSTSGFSSYEMEIDVGNALEYTVSVPDSWEEVHFAVVAYSSPTLKSGYSQELSAYAVAAGAAANGRISPSGTSLLSQGAQQAFSFSADPGYAVADVTVDGKSVGQVGTYTVSNIQAPHSIAASFVPVGTPQTSYTLTASSGGHGSISPAGSVKVSPGGSQTFALAPDAGYHVADLQVDGSSVGGAASYSFSAVTSNHTIAATFAPDATPQPSSYTLTASAGAHGSVSPAGSVSVAEGGSQVFAISPEAGYAVSDVLVDGSSVGSRASYSFNNVSSNHTLSAVFAALDANGNQLPDDWERKYFGSAVVDPQGDFDGDGVTNYAEYVNGTDPTVANLDSSLTPAVSAPVSGGTLASLTPELTVYNPLNPNQVQLAYEFQIARDEDMTDIVASAQDIPEGVGQTTWAVPNSLPDQTRYYWRAKATADSVASPWTPVCTFVLDSQAKPTTSELQDSAYVVAEQGAALQITDETSAANNVEVDLPPQALSYDYVLTIGVVSNPPPASGQTRVLGKVVEFGPHGVALNAPAKILLPYTAQNLQDAGVTDPTKLNVLTYNTEALAWEKVPVTGVDYLGQRLVCDVQHFSMYAVGTADQSAAPEPQTPASGAASGGGGGGGCFIRSLLW